ncbi:hypothetical protein AC578_7560 [Pseudocercospora eumusae]|uniref:Plastocyanin-like domain-containing protein n=1 Tax=Pseudocercospora eumusae TaxID=321146 RepID=A0A139HRJ1_9PEZI|nr:hypothetical protein AC578_7560 [Pseudocercospora eumusae]
MTVVAKGLIAVKPYTVNYITLFVGQRTDVLVTAHQPAVHTGSVHATYDNGVNTTKRPTTLPQLDFITPTLITCGGNSLTKTEPYYPTKLDPLDTTVTIQITQAVHETGHTHYLMNGRTFRANYNYPLLNLTFNGNTSYPDDPQGNIYNFGTNETIRKSTPQSLSSFHPLQNSPRHHLPKTTFPSPNPCTFTVKTCTWSTKKSAPTTASSS